MREHGHARLGLDARDQALAAARDDEVDHALRRQHRADRGAIGGGHQLDRVGGQAGGGEPGDQRGVDRAVALPPLPIRRAGSRHCPPSTHRARGVGGDVGAAFVDDADHADRHAHARQARPLGRSVRRSPAPTGSASAATARRRRPSPRRASDRAAADRASRPTARPSARAMSLAFAARIRPRHRGSPAPRGQPARLVGRRHSRERAARRRGHAAHRGDQGDGIESTSMIVPCRRASTRVRRQNHIAFQRPNDIHRA